MSGKSGLSRRALLKAAGVAAAALPLQSLQAGAITLPGGEASLSEERLVPTVCGMCPARCLVTATVRDGRVISLAGTGDNHLNGSLICARGMAAPDLLYDPDRLKYPMKRVGPRGSGQWQRISWAEAIDVISLRLEQTLRRHGPDALALFAAGPSAAYIKELFTELGASRVNDSHYEHCRCNREAAYLATFGFDPGAPARVDYERTRCLVLLGSHFGENLMLPEFRRFMDSQEQGAHLIVADPRRSVIAAQSDEHLMLKPGSDTALLLGWINYLLQRDLFDRDYIAAHALGLDELREHAAAYPLERVAELTGLSPKAIEQSARRLAASAPAVIIHPGRHSNWYGDDVDRLRAQAILAALLGAPGRPGGMPLPGVNEPGAEATPYARSRQRLARALQPDSRERAEEIFKDLEADRIKVLGCWGQNPFHGYPNPYRTSLAWRRAEFIFACDVVPSEPCLMADIILPEATFLERSDRVELRREVEPPLLTARFPVLPPAFEARDPYWIVRQLSIRLGRGRGLRYPEVSSRLEHDLTTWRLRLDDLRRGRAFVSLPAAAEPQLAEFRFPTLSGKIELVSRDLAEAAQAPLPQFRPPPEPPAGYFRLLYGRSQLHTLSSTQNNRRLMSEQGENELWLNEEVAAGLGMGSGDRVLLENQDGLTALRTVRLYVSRDIRPDCVYLVHGFGHRSHLLSRAFHQGVADGSLMSRATANPITGVRALRNNFVRIRKERS
ncbi:molybdopterin-containing oxidoreductase family protein [Desulfurivibrio dismutans]|uniref:molybdopterin-containing oxidoreductase family protein n=1 Tax=Desulfurivibrio dismutans TaxID=1398908 RepID=UPI0023DBB9AB|nr:molybdopterin-dependent oxidoreductase [Desulfurivibrio alkaliphilus]MDF1615363.1 molybdopterin-dependent oxidoreductase [Desulfurivibrio alkaliphilus]